MIVMVQDITFKEDFTFKGELIHIEVKDNLILEMVFKNGFVIDIFFETEQEKKETFDLFKEIE